MEAARRYRLETFAIVTTEPNELVAQIHDRLALILHPRDYDRWLGIDDKGGDPLPPHADQVGLSDK